MSTGTRDRYKRKQKSWPEREREKTDRLLYQMMRVRQTDRQTNRLTQSTIYNTVYEMSTGTRGR